MDKDLLSEELEQANKKLNWYNEKMKDYSDLQTENEQLKKDLEIQQETNQSNLQHFDQYEKAIAELQQQIEQFNHLENEHQSAKNQIEELNRLLNEERQRCDALSTDNDSICQLLEETRAQNLQTERDFHKTFEEKLQEKEQQIVYLQDQLKTEV